MTAPKVFATTSGHMTLTVHPDGAHVLAHCGQTVELVGQPVTELTTAPTRFDVRAECFAIANAAAAQLTADLADAGVQAGGA